MAWKHDYYVLLNWLSLQRVNSVILGDLNEDLLEKPDFAKDIMVSFNISQHIDKPTRITAHSETLIDHIYTTDRNMISSSDVYELHLSNHKAVFYFMNSLSSSSKRVRQRPREIEYRSFSKLNTEQLICDLTKAPWSILSMLDDISDKVDAFLGIFNDVWNILAPMIKRRVRKHGTPWMTHDVLKLIHQHECAYRGYLKSPSDDHRMKYKMLRNKVTTAVRNAKRIFFIEGARKGTKQF